MIDLFAALQTRAPTWSIARRDFGIASYTLLLSMVEFKTLCMRGDVPASLQLLPQLPKDQVRTTNRQAFKH